MTRPMKFFTIALSSITAVMAMPDNSYGVAGDSDVMFPVDKGTTIQQAQARCGNDAQVNCCERATYTHDVTSGTGLLPGVVQTALGGGPGAEGLGLFGKCKEIKANGNLVTQKCKSNISCSASQLPRTASASL